VAHWGLLRQKKTANEMEDELNMILNTSIEHESHMDKINVKLFTCHWGYPVKNDILFLDNMFPNCYRDILL